MLGYRMRFAAVLGAILLASCWSAVLAKTWHLGEGQGWKALSGERQDKYLLAAAQIKQLVDTGQTKAVGRALDKLKKDFPEIAGSDLDAFMKAEMLLCEGRFTRAAKAYGKFLDEYPESKFYEAALDRQFAVATAFLAGQKRAVFKFVKIRGYAEGARIMDRISDRAGDAPIGTKAAVAVARSLEKRRKFNEAYHKWSQISSWWPMGSVGKDALLGMARCKQAAYKGPKYDVSDLISAKSYYENFKLRYPKDAKEFDLDEKLEQIDEHLAYKQFSIGQYYQKSGNKQSAHLYYQMVLDNWPGSTAAKMAKQIMNGKDLQGEKVKK